MDDKELLELAAKAAGYPFQWRGLNKALPSIFVGRDQQWWNPLADDGDALRLAVKLCLHMNIEPYGSSARKQGNDWLGCEAHLHGGLAAATRRAIVRAAAAIARQESSHE